MGNILPTKIRLKWWPKHGKKNTKLAILKGLGWKHIRPERKPPRKTIFVIWSYDYRFVRGKMVYIRIGTFLLFTNKKTAFVTFFDLSGSIILYSIVQSSSFVFWEVRLTSGMHAPTSVLVLLCVSFCLKLKIYVSYLWFCNSQRFLHDLYMLYKGMLVVSHIFCLLASPRENLCYIVVLYGFCI